MISPEWFLVGVLLVIILFQGVMIHKLVNKVMSRNYQEYVNSERLKKPTNVSKTTPKSAVFDPIAERNASDANRLLAF